jgi:hypothetical protein
MLSKLSGRLFSLFLLVALGQDRALFLYQPDVPVVLRDKLSENAQQGTSAVLFPSIFEGRNSLSSTLARTDIVDDDDGPET